jgi:hypothetical protein
LIELIWNKVEVTKWFWSFNFDLLLINGVVLTLLVYENGVNADWLLFSLPFYKSYLSLSK